MKKLSTTLFLMVLFTCVSFAQTTLYETSFETESDFSEWTVVDANNDAATWQFNNDAEPSKVFYSYSSNNADDWLISPAITTTEDITMMVQYSVKGSSYYKESFEVYKGTGNTVAEMTTLLDAHTPVTGNVETFSTLFEVKAGETFRIGFRCTSPADLYRLYLCSVTVKSVANPIDLRVDSIESPSTGWNLSQEAVKVKITNKGLVAASNFEIGFSVDSVEVAKETVAATLDAGASMEYTFNATADLSIPRHLYNVSAYVVSADDIDNSNDTLSTSVRHKAAATVPYTMGFEYDEYTEDIKFYNLNEDDGNWQLYTGTWYNFARTGYTCLGYNYDKNNTADDWAILEPIKIEEAGDYVLRFWYSGDDNHPEKLAVYYGNGDTPEAMTNKVVEYAPFARGSYEESVSIIHLDQPQTLYVGFYAFSNKDENWITIDDVQFYKATGDNVDIMATNLQRPFDFVRTPNAENAVFELRNIGITNADVKVTVTIDGEVKSVTDISMTAQEYKTIQASGVLKDLAAGSHELKIYVDCDADSNAANDTITKTIYVLGTPVKFYDFEDGVVPDDFVFRTEDTGTINPDAGEEWNEYGWGILNVESSMYGTKTFAGNTWLDNVDKADRWVVFPKFKVVDNDAYFVWDASSGNSIYREDYQVKVSDGSMEPKDYWYITEKEVTSEDIYPTTRGISLGKYAGKEVYVAIRLTSKISEFLALDNIGFYGNVDFTTGIGAPSVNAGGVTVMNGVVVAEGAQSIVISDASGRTVAKAVGSKADVSSLASGVYMATVKSGDGVKTVKFLKK